tara:strand:+ start:480 stop:1577 length:1098 start_codon:yes stop_codon:yes gene_type:complete
MKNYFLLQFINKTLKEYIFIFLTSIILLFISITKSFSEEDVFTIDGIKVKGAIDVNFSREKYLNRAFSNSFDVMMNKILLTSDLKKVEKLKLKEIKKLVRSFKILEESYREDIYRAELRVVYSEKRVKEFLREKNISFSLPKNISAVFFPVFYINGKMQSLNENFFYKNWEKIKIKNELINFILPLEDLDDVSHITKMRDNLEDLDVLSLVSKYGEKNYVFVLMDYEKTKLNIYLKTNFNNNTTSKNISYEVKNIHEEIMLNSILKDLKLEIIDLWKEQNLINLLMPLSIKIKFKHSKLKDLDKLRKTFYKIGIVNSYTLEEFNINNSNYKIYYYGNPKKLKAELLKYGYELINNQGVWQLYLHE